MRTEHSLPRRYYQVFDFILETDIELRGVPLAKSRRAAITATLASLTRCEQQSWVHEWKSPDGSTAFSLAERGGGYLLSFPEAADFCISPGLDQIQVDAHAAATPDTLAHLLLDQVLPRVLSHGGKLVVHASAVELPGGQVVAFMGNTGSGKSTLASSFLTSGCRLLSDDCLLLEQRGGQVLATPAYPGLRLWPDSVQALFASTDRFRPVSHYSDKQKLELSTEIVGPPTVALEALFLLGQTDDPGQSAKVVSISPAEGAQAAIAVLESIFALEPAGADSVQRNFRLAGGLLSGALPVLRLDYPRDYAVLAEVRQAVEAEMVRRKAGNSRRKQASSVA